MPTGLCWRATREQGKKRADSEAFVPSTPTLFARFPFETKMSAWALSTPRRFTPKSARNLGGSIIMLETLQDMLDTVRAVQARCQLLAMAPHLHQFYTPDDLPVMLGLLAETVSAGVYDPLFGLELQLKALIQEAVDEAKSSCSGENSPKAIATKGKP